MRDHDEPEWLQHERRQEALRDKAENEPRPKNKLELWDEQFAPPELEDEPLTYEDGIRAAIAEVEKEREVWQKKVNYYRENGPQASESNCLTRVSAVSLCLARLRGLLPAKPGTSPEVPAKEGE